ncbi:MAG: radical SAM protein, partial [Bacteroidales bacterium]|nr:radical SAM protein [Bacteroidales bacterium]
MNGSPYLLVSDEKGNIFEDTSLRVVGREGNKVKLLEEKDFIFLPDGSDFFYLPKRKAVGLNPKTGNLEISKKGYAVSAFNAPAYTQTAIAAWIKEKDAPVLPLFAYTAVGWHRGKFYTTALRIDPDIR